MSVQLDPAMAPPKHRNLPPPSSTISYWRTHPHALDEHRSSADVPRTVDIAVIGAGMSGASSAYHLLKHKPDTSVAIFEARQACSGATGRNGGHSKIAPVSLLNMCDRVDGEEAAQEFAAFIRKVLLGLKACVDEEGIECEFLVTRSWDVFLDQTHADEMEHKFKALNAKKADWLKDIQFLKGEHVARLTGLPQAKAALSSPAVSLWPYKFVMGLLEKCLDMGANLQTMTPVLKITRDSASGYSLLETERGVTKAKKVIFATNAYLTNLLPEYDGIVVPFRGTACHITSEAPESNMPTLSHTYNIHQSAVSREYMNPRPDGSIVLGGGQILYRENKKLWFDSVDDTTQLILEDGSTVKERYFEGYMARHFTRCQNIPNGEFVDQTWTGIMGHTPDGRPHIGAVPDREDWFLMAGFNGAGMTSIFEAARALVGLSTLR